MKKHILSTLIAAGLAIASTGSFAAPAAPAAPITTEALMALNYVALAMAVECQKLNWVPEVSLADFRRYQNSDVKTVLTGYMARAGAGPAALPVLCMDEKSVYHGGVAWIKDGREICTVHETGAPECTPFAQILTP